MRGVEFRICPFSLSEFTNKQFLNVPLHVLCTFLVLVVIRGLAYIWKLQWGTWKFSPKNLRTEKIPRQIIFKSIKAFKRYVARFLKRCPKMKVFSWTIHDSIHPIEKQS